ncbi:MAG: response regulator [Oscillospiraceae bacterium]|nr:response regulator [Oscillospiraceae bacterium]
MNNPFGETLRKLRLEKGLSQKQLGDLLFIDNSAIARWESGKRLPDAMMVTRLAGCLGVDSNTLFRLAASVDENPNIIMVDDNKITLSHGLNLLEEVITNASIMGFTKPAEAIEYAKINRIALAILDIELGKSSGLDLCSTLLEINPCTNIVFLTAYADYGLDAWKTDAIGFLLKPLTTEAVKAQLKKLRYPFSTKSAAK